MTAFRLLSSVDCLQRSHSDKKYSIDGLWRKSSHSYSHFSNLMTESSCPCSHFLCLNSKSSYPCSHFLGLNSESSYIKLLLLSFDLQFVILRFSLFHTKSSIVLFFALTTTIIIWLISLTASKELSILLLKLYNERAIGISSILLGLRVR